MNWAPHRPAPLVCATALASAWLLAGAQLPPAGQPFDTLLDEVRQAQQAQDHERLKTLYAEMAALRPGDPQSQRGLGLACYLTGDYDGAVSALERADALEPGMAGVALYLAIGYYRSNRFPEALEAVERAPELESGEPMARFWQGASNRALGRLAEAIPPLEEALASGGPNAEVLQLLTRTYSEHAAEWFRRLLSGAGSSPAARLLRAEELAVDGIHQAALQELDTALDHAPRLAGLHLAKGQILWSRQEYSEGVGEFRLELENDPVSAEARLRLGAYLLDRGSAAEAIKHLRLAKRYRPDDRRIGQLLTQAQNAAGPGPARHPVVQTPAPFSESTLEAALALYRAGEARGAAAVLERHLSARPASLEARRLLAHCHMAVGNLRPAASHLGRVLDTVPDDPETLYRLGKVYEDLASAAADRLFDIDPTSASIRLLRGESFERGPRFDFDRALEEFVEATKLDPAQAGVHQAIGRVLFKMRRFDEAVPHLEAALARNPGHGIASYLLGKIKLQQGQREQAIRSLRAAVRARPGLADARRDLAGALVREGELEEGIRIYEDLLETQSGDASLHALLATAYRRAGRTEDAKEQANKARALARR